VNAGELDTRKRTAEDVPSAVRHGLRNKLAAMRNSVFYIQKSLSKMGILEHDPRVPRFLALIEAEIEEADRLLDSPSGPSPAELRTASRPEP